MKRSLDQRAAAVAFTTHWLLGRYGMATMQPGGPDEIRWRVEPASPRRPFVVSIEGPALETGLGALRDRLEEIAEHVLSHSPSPTHRYHVTPTGIEMRSD